MTLLVSDSTKRWMRVSPLREIWRIMDPSACFPLPFSPNLHYDFELDERIKVAHFLPRDTTKHNL